MNITTAKAILAVISSILPGLHFICIRPPGPSGQYDTRFSTYVSIILSGTVTPVWGKDDEEKKDG
jgi:hypothetical protein